MGSVPGEGSVDRGSGDREQLLEFADHVPAGGVERHKVSLLAGALRREFGHRVAGRGRARTSTSRTSVSAGERALLDARYGVPPVILRSI